MADDSKPLVGIVMGSKSDWETMSHASETLARFDVPCECKVVSAHRTPKAAHQYAASADSRGLEVLIAGASAAAHLAGVVAAYSTLPVLGVPMQTSTLGGLDSLLSTVQMPGGIPVATFAIGKAGTINAALFAISILGRSRPELRDKLRKFREEQRQKVLDTTPP